MAQRRSSGLRTTVEGLENRGPVICLLGAISAVVGCFWFALFYLSQPAVYSNPGLAAYPPAPATQLVNAPEVAPPPSLTALAQEQTPQKPTKQPDPRHKHGRAVPHENDQRVFAYAQAWNTFGSVRQWDNSYRDSSFKRGGTPHPRKTGGPKSSF
jgi:hypothetical protein